MIPLEHLGRWYGGGTPSKSQPRYWNGGTVPWLSPKDMQSARLHDTRDHITALAAKETAAKLIPAASVAVVVRSGILERRIPVALVPFETSLNQDMKAIVARDGVLPEWIAWGLLAFEHELLRATRKAGTTVASLNFAALRSFKLPLPPSAQQRRIVEVLEEHLSKLDRAVADVRALRERVETWLEATLRMALSSGDPAVFGDLLDVAALPSRNVEVRTAGPHGRWPVVDQGDGTVRARSDDETAVFSGALPVIVFGDHTRRIKLIREAFAIGGSGVKVLTPRVGVDADFAYWAARAAEVPARGYGRHFALLRSAEFRTGTSSFQQAVVAVMEEAAAVRETSRSGLDRVTRRAETLRAALLRAAFSGQLTGRPSDLDRAEEAIAS